MCNKCQMIFYQNTNNDCSLYKFNYNVLYIINNKYVNDSYMRSYNLIYDKIIKRTWILIIQTER